MTKTFAIVKFVLLITSSFLGFVCSSDETFNVSLGDIVKIVAPASKSSDSALPLIKNYIESLGLVANISDNIYSTVDPFYSNTDEFRANDLISALVDDNVKVIWCVRGGTGSIRLVPFLEEKLPPVLTHKIFIGYSDITVLHLYLQSKYGWQTIQGPMADAISTGRYDLTSESVVSLEALIFETQDRICLNATKLNSRINVTRIESKVVGGNAALVEASIGTLWQVNTKGRIFFLEDVGEAAYSIERSLDHMKQAGIFNDVDAVIFGDFTETNDELMTVVFDRFAEWASFPVFRVTGMGHGPVNLPLPFLTPSYINSIDGVTYEFCVDNIQNQKTTSVISGQANRNLSGLLAAILTGCYLLINKF
ncbi:putative carboxypeptidase [Pseudolycoriella hygida]|uniref:Carboxypeptidase n=1 Tax=Pseudolycoriella hygida TaxID=35572 RepID=A0A9Q0S6S5_9DIPT|nr:putative carboxypeptidase [Pseudolycoriella hygida]